MDMLKALARAFGYLLARVAVIVGAGYAVAFGLLDGGSPIVWIREAWSSDDDLARVLARLGVLVVLGALASIVVAVYGLLRTLAGAWIIGNPARRAEMIRARSLTSGAAASPGFFWLWPENWQFVLSGSAALGLIGFIAVGVRVAAALISLFAASDAGAGEDDGGDDLPSQELGETSSDEADPFGFDEDTLPEDQILTRGAG